MRLLIKRIMWGIALGVVTGVFAGMIDYLTVVLSNSSQAQGVVSSLHLPDVIGWYGIFWAGTAFLYSVFLVSAQWLAGKAGAKSSNFSVHILSFAFTMCIYIAFLVWINDRFLPYALSWKSLAGNVLFLVSMIIPYSIFYLLFKASLDRLKATGARRWAIKAVSVLSLFILLDALLSISADLAGPRPSPHARNANLRPDVNVVFITLDALRPDHLSCYGYKRSTTPNIDLLAKDGYLFTNAMSNAPRTFFSFSSMFTSIYPDALNACQFIPITSKVTTLGESLSRAGIGTAAVLTNPYLSRAFMVTRGFQYVYHSFEPAFMNNFQNTHLYFFLLRIWNRVFFEENALVFTDRVIKWIKNNHSKPFFLCVHYIEPHFPYGDVWIKNAPPDPNYHGPLGDHINDAAAIQYAQQQTKPVSKEDLLHVEYLYDRDIHYADQQIGRLFEYLKQSGLWEKTVIILSADHGEAFNEHQFIGHWDFLYWEFVHIPLLIKPAGKILPGPGTISAPVESLDLYPTILDIFQVPVPDTVQGKSLIPLINGQTSKDKDYFYSTCNRDEYARDVIRDDRYTLRFSFQDKTIQLFDRLKDPWEQKDIAGAEPQIVQKMLAALQERVEANRKLYLKFYPEGKTRAAVRLDAKALRALGYVQ